MSKIDAYPLAWPQGRPRNRNQKNAQFGKTGNDGGKAKLTINDALRRLQGELDALKIEDYVLSTNFKRRLDGSLVLNEGTPMDTGVALYFTLKGKPHCLPCDTFFKVADNIAAIAAHIKATRAIERWGVADLSEMFAGFQALPAPTARRHWREVLEFGFDVNVHLNEIEKRFRELAKRYHPDNKETGSTEKMAELNLAKADALMEIGG